MNKEKIHILLFAFMVLAFLITPAVIVSKGIEFNKNASTHKFRIQAENYHTLYNYGNDYTYFDFTYAISESEFGYGNTVYVKLEKDKKGFSKFKKILKDEPTNTADYIKAKIVSGNIIKDNKYTDLFDSDIDYKNITYSDQEEAAKILKQVYPNAKYAYKIDIRYSGMYGSSDLKGYVFNKESGKKEYYESNEEKYDGYSRYPIGLPKKYYEHDPVLVKVYKGRIFFDKQIEDDNSRY